MSPRLPAQENKTSSTSRWNEENQETTEILRQAKKLLLLQQAMGVDGYTLAPGHRNIFAATGAGDPLPLEPPPGLYTPETGKARSRKETLPKPLLDDIREELGDCRRCGLCADRHAIVFGTGNSAARLLIIGEWPNREDDATGEPFSGEAGELLEKMLAAIGLRRQEVYTAYAVKCFPAGDAPGKEAVKACLPFLLKQIEAIAPEIICTMGSLATRALLGAQKNLLQVRGRFHDFHGIPVMPTLPPSLLNNNPEMKKAAWHDLQMIEKLYKQVKQA